MSISEFVQVFLSFCGGVSIIGGAVAVILKWITPAYFDSTSELRHWKNMISEITRVFRGSRSVIH
jgi:hypothetical protein